LTQNVSTRKKNVSTNSLCLVFAGITPVSFAIKGLRQQEATELVKKFDFTPGEINNVARRFMVENLLGLEKSRLQTLIELCETEHYERNHTSNIGFSFEKSLTLKSKAI